MNTHKNGDVFAHSTGHFLELRIVGNEVFDVADTLDVLQNIIGQSNQFILRLSIAWRKQTKELANKFNYFLSSHGLIEQSKK